MTSTPAAPGVQPAAVWPAERERIEAAIHDATRAALAETAPWLREPLAYALGSGGKRVRPLLCLASFRAVRGGDSPEPAPPGIYVVAAAIEIIHTYSLVHDDLPCMDDDDLRRGRPTAHRVFGAPAATVAGAALITLACIALERGGRELGLSPRERRTLVGELCRAAGAGGMVGGQLMDLEAEGRRIDVDALEAIHRRKTGALLAASVRIGALAARAPREVVDALDRYGRAVGLAFQIADDILDVTGSDAVLGKTAGRDQALSKATYPALLGLDRAKRRAAAEVENAVLALRHAGLAAPELEALARLAVERDS